MRRLIATMGIPALLGLGGLACGSGADGSAGEPVDTTAAEISKESPVLFGVNDEGAAEFETATGLTTQVVRVYLKGGDKIPSSVSSANLTSYYAAGQAVVFSMKVDMSPDSEATNKENLAALSKDIVSKGYAGKTWIVLHHEPYPELDGTAFQTMYSTYAPTVRSAGLRCGVIYQTYPLYHSDPSYVTDYTSGILPIVDFIGIDVYPAGLPGGYSSNILSDISPFTSYAKSNGKRFQIDEVAVDDTVTGTQAEQASWLAGLASLGGSVDLVMYYEGSPGAFLNLKIENNPDAVAEWKTLYGSLTKR
jgi:hypothetical protein